MNGKSETQCFHRYGANLIPPVAIMPARPRAQQPELVQQGLRAHAVGRPKVVLMQKGAEMKIHGRQF